MEGGVYRCRWARAGRGFRISLVADPGIAVDGATFEQAEAAFCERLGALYADGEPALEYEIPAPRSALQQRYTEPDLVRLLGAGSFRLLNDAELFSSRACSTCEVRRGVRRDTQIECERIPRSADVASAGVNSAFQHVTIFSEAFVSLLTEPERAMLVLRPVQRAGRSVKGYFEIVDYPIASLVGVPRFPGRLQKRCGACGVDSFDYLYGNEVYNFVALEDLPDPLPTVFVVAEPRGGLTFCMTRARYSELRDQPGTRGLIAAQMYVVPDGRFLRAGEDEDYPDELMSPRCGRPLSRD
jgi:hypothetical protein